jgi:hypothetical protein
MQAEAVAAKLLPVAKHGTTTPMLPPMWTIGKRLLRAINA